MAAEDAVRNLRAVFRGTASHAWAVRLSSPRTYNEKEWRSMCFSASASFVAGSSLSVLGVAAIRNTRARNELPVAMIPLLFGIQQLIEGVIWVTFRNEAPQLKQAMTIAFLGFAYVLWPMYVPLALGVLEGVRWRKRTLFAFLAAGIPVGLYLLHAIATSSLVAEVLGKHIVYVTPHPNLLIVGVLYVGATCLSCFFSSHGFLRLFGVLALLSLIAAYLVHVRALVSLWCFFAAILSLLIYFHLKFRSLGGFPAERHSPAVAHAP